MRATLSALGILAAGCSAPPLPADTPPPPAIRPTADELRQLHGVEGVEVLVAAPNPTHRIVHVRDRHHVPRDLFARDVRHAEKHAVTDEEMSERSAAFLKDVDAVQREQERSSVRWRGTTGCGEPWSRG